MHNVEPVAICLGHTFSIVLWLVNRDRDPEYETFVI